MEGLASGLYPRLGPIVSRQGRQQNWFLSRKALPTYPLEVELKPRWQKWTVDTRSVMCMCPGDEEVVGRNAGTTNRGYNIGASPWAMSWQLNERYTSWSKTNQGRLVALIASGKFSSREEFDSRMVTLCEVVPDFEDSLPYVHPHVLVDILQTLDCGAGVVLALRTALGDLDVDVSRVVCAYPEVLTWSVKQMDKTLNNLIGKFGTLQGLAHVMNQVPWVLDVDKFENSMNSVQRLLGLSAADAADRVLDQPELLDSCVKCSDTLGQSAYFDPSTNSWRD